MTAVWTILMVTVTVLLMINDGVYIKTTLAIVRLAISILILVISTLAIILTLVMILGVIRKMMPGDSVMLT